MTIFCWHSRIADTAMSVEAMAPQSNNMIGSKMKMIVQLARWAEAERTLLHSRGCGQSLVLQFLFRRFCNGYSNASKNGHLIKKTWNTGIRLFCNYFFLYAWHSTERAIISYLLLYVRRIKSEEVRITRATIVKLNPQMESLVYSTAVDKTCGYTNSLTMN